jgi:hypothetical protein
MKTSVHRRSAGFTIVELMISAVLITVMAVAVGRMSLSGADAQGYAARLNRVTELNQDLIDRMRLELVSSVRLFTRGTEGDGNRALLDLTGMPAPLATSVLPTLAAGSQVQADTVGAEITGNSLFFAKLAWTDRFVCSSGGEYLVDVYRWVYYYQALEGSSLTPGSPTGLDFVRFTSEPLADAAGIDRITDLNDRAELLQHLATGTADADGLVRDRTEVIWRRGADPAITGTLRYIDSSGLMSNDPGGSRPDPWQVLPATQRAQGLLRHRHHSLATNSAPAGWGAARFGVMSDVGEGFPHGFEVQVVGPSSARQVLLHLVLASTNRRGQTAWSGMQAIVDCRDL